MRKKARKEIQETKRKKYNFLYAVLVHCTNFLLSNSKLDEDSKASLKTKEYWLRIEIDVTDGTLTQGRHNYAGLFQLKRLIQ